MIVSQAIVIPGPSPADSGAAAIRRARCLHSSKSFIWISIPKEKPKPYNCHMERPEGFNEAALLPAFNWGVPLRWRRTSAGLKTNVRWIVRHHSLGGFEIGDPGPGPADLALNILATLFPCEGESIEQCIDGKVSRQAWALHQDFKFEFLATADRDQGEIEWDIIEAWLLERGIEVD